MNKFFRLGATLLVMVLLVSGCTKGTYTFTNSIENSGKDAWAITYEKFNGTKQREVVLEDGTEHFFQVQVTTNSGRLGLSISKEDGTSIYKGKDLPTSSFEVKTDGGGKYIIHFDAENHNGSFDIKWE